MRTFDEIQTDARQAASINDAEALMYYASELDAITSPQTEALASAVRGLAHRLYGDYSAALEYFHRALALYEELDNRIGIANVTSNIGLVYRNTGDYPAALEHFHRGLALHEELGNLSGVAIVTSNIGNVHHNTGDYPLALLHHHRALALHEELGDRSGVAIVTGNIGNVYLRTGDYEMALEYQHRALTINEELGNRSGAAAATSNIGLVYNITGDYTAALKHFHRTVALFEDLKDLSGVAVVTGNILTAYVAMGSGTEAQALLQAMDAMRIDDPGARITREHQRAALQERDGDLAGATLSLQHALAEAKQHGLRSDAANTHKNLRDLAQKGNDFARYIEHNNEFTRITEEINGKEATLKMAMQAKQREIDAKDREHAQHMAVLHSTLPKHIADRVARGETVNDHYDNAAVIFLDIVGFTTISDRIPSGHVVHLLEQIFSTLDAVCEQHNVVKIKTIGDSYMAVAFPGEPSSSEQRAASAAIDMLIAISHLHPGLSGGLLANVLVDLPEGLQVRIGLHCGPVTAGVIGTTRMQYDVWGDTVNVASRMESSSEPGRIHVSSSFALALSQRHQDLRQQDQQLQDDMSSPFPVPFSLRERGALEIKGKGTMRTYWLESPLP